MIDPTVPAWLARRAVFGDDSVSRDLQAGFQMGQQMQENQLRREQFGAQQDYREQQLQSLMAYRESQMAATEARQKLAADEVADATLISQWMMNPRQPPPAGLKTPKGLRTVAEIQKGYSDTEIGSKFAAANKAFADKIKELDATGALRVQEALDKTEGKITSDVATLIDNETVRIKSTMADTRVLDEQGQPYVEGSGKAAFLQSLKTGSLHKLPPDWSGGMQLIPLRDEDGSVKGYGVPNSSGGITQLRETKPPAESVMDPVTKAAMSAEFKALQSWRESLPPNPKGKDGKPLDVEAEYQRRLKALEEKYRVTPTPATQPEAKPVLRYNPATRTFE